jgi:hypothetical protein
LNTKKTTTYGVGNPGSGLRIYKNMTELSRVPPTPQPLIIGSLTTIEIYANNTKPAQIRFHRRTTMILL